MKKLGVMAGEWRGTAVINGREGRMSAISYEKVESKLGGLALWVYGRHVDAADTTKIVHEAVGMLYYDGPAQKLKFVPMVMNGLTADAWANATDPGEHRPRPCASDRSSLGATVRSGPALKAPAQGSCSRLLLKAAAQGFRQRLAQ